MRTKKNAVRRRIQKCTDFFRFYHGRRLEILRTLTFTLYTAGILLSTGCPAPESETLPPPAVREYPAADEIERLLRSAAVSRSVAVMSIEEKIGQLLLIQVRYGPNGEPLRVVDPETAALVARLKPGGVVLFGENIWSPEQAVRFIRDLQAASPGPALIVAADQEGGLVDRLDDGPDMHATRVPAASILGTAGEAAGYAAGYIAGTELRSLGITMNLAPVADIASDRDSFIGTRSFGGDPEHVSRMVSAFVRGSTAAGTASVLKHYPGHGGTVLDSHAGSVSFSTDRAGLLSHDLFPFERGFAAGAAGVMAAHIAFPSIDPSGYPASISPILLHGILRGELAFDGLIITDALEMQGIRRIMSSSEAAVQAVLAGADMIMTPVNPQPTFDALLGAVASGELDVRRIDRSVHRILLHKAVWGSGPGRLMSLEDAVRYAETTLGAPEHREMLDEALGIDLP